MSELLYCFVCRSHTFLAELDAPKQTIMTCGTCGKKCCLGTIRGAMKQLSVSPQISTDAKL